MARDGCAVPTAALSRVLTEFVSSWKREHAYKIGGDGWNLPDESEQPISPYDYLVAETAATGNPVSMATLKRIQQQDTQVTELRHADAILTVLDREYMLASGEIETVPNPTASASARSQCCSTSELRRFTGSLTGVVSARPVL